MAGWAIILLVEAANHAKAADYASVSFVALLSLVVAVNIIAYCWDRVYQEFSCRS
jgi:hypothetical protein